MTVHTVGLRQHRPRERHRVTKGYSANRVAYDARRRRSPRTADTKAYMALLRRDPCCFCGALPVERVQDVDHIVPLDGGGLDRWENMTAACASCNRGRRDRDLLTTLLRRATA